MIHHAPRAVRRRRIRPPLLVPLLLGGAAACTSPTAVEPDPEVVPIAGSWEATSVVLTSKEDPGVTFDLIEEGGAFFLNIQPSGRYTASLTFLGQTGGETGQVTVSGNIVTLNPDAPGLPTTSGTFELQGVSRLIIDGETEFDFNRDGEDEGAFVRFDFTKA